MRRINPPFLKSHQVKQWKQILHESISWSYRLFRSQRQRSERTSSILWDGLKQCKDHAKRRERERLSHFVFTDKEEQTAVIPKGLCRNMGKYSTFTWIAFTALCQSFTECTGCKNQRCLEHVGCLMLLLLLSEVGTRCAQLHTCFLI